MVDTYREPEMEVVRFEEEDVIVTSLGCGNGGSNETQEDCLLEH